MGYQLLCLYHICPTYDVAKTSCLWNFWYLLLRIVRLFGQLDTVHTYRWRTRVVAFLHQTFLTYTTNLLYLQMDPTDWTVVARDSDLPFVEGTVLCLDFLVCRLISIFLLIMMYYQICKSNGRSHVDRERGTEQRFHGHIHHQAWSQSEWFGSNAETEVWPRKCRFLQA